MVATALGTSSPSTMCTTVASTSATATDTPNGVSDPKSASIPGATIGASAGSIMKPSSSDDTVMPICAPERWNDRRATRRWTIRARRSPAPARSSTRVLSTVTRANSVATKAAVAAISARAANSHSAISIAPPRIDGPFSSESTAPANCFPLTFAALTGRSASSLA